VWPAQLLLLYVPVLVMVLRRPNVAEYPMWIGGANYPGGPDGMSQTSSMLTRFFDWLWRDAPKRDREGAERIIACSVAGAWISQIRRRRSPHNPPRPTLHPILTRQLILRLEVPGAGFHRGRRLGMELCRSALLSVEVPHEGQVVRAQAVRGRALGVCHRRSFAMVRGTRTMQINFQRMHFSITRVGT